MERKKLAPGVFITTLDAEKFNRCRITIHLRYPALRRSLLSSLDSLGDSLGGLESWYYGQILRDEALAPPEYGKVLTNAVTADEVREVLQSYHYSVGYTLTAKGEGENA